MVQTNADLRLQGAHRQFNSPRYTELVNRVIETGGTEQAGQALRSLSEYMLDEAFLHVLVIAPGVAVKSTSLQKVPFTLGGLRPAESCLTR